MNDVLAATRETEQEYELKDPPKDGISSVHFFQKESAGQDHLLVTSWDTTARIYNVNSNTLQGYMNTDAPLLDGCWGDENHTSWVCGLSGKVLKLDWTADIQKEFASHEEAIKSILYDSYSGLLITGSWDKTVKIWDPRSSNPLLHTIAQPERVYSMDLTGNTNINTGKLVVAMAGRWIYVYDMKKLPVPIQKRESSLKYQTRCVKCSPSGESFICTSIEGRVAVEYFDADPLIQAKKYAFKCHRMTVPDVDGTLVETVYPINSVSFHSRFGTFVTGGSDGIVSVWDGTVRKRIKSFPQYSTSISSLDFNHSGSLLAIASSYMYEEGERDHPLDTIFIRRVQESDVKTKSQCQ